MYNYKSVSVRRRIIALECKEVFRCTTYVKHVSTNNQFVIAITFSTHNASRQPIYNTYYVPNSVPNIRKENNFNSLYFKVCF